MATREVGLDELYAVRGERCGLLSVIFGVGGGMFSFLYYTNCMGWKKLMISPRNDFSKEPPPLHLSYPTASPAPAFRCKIDAKYFCQIFLDKPKRHPYTPSVEKQCLINSIQFQSILAIARSILAS